MDLKNKGKNYLNKYILGSSPLDSENFFTLIRMHYNSLLKIMHTIVLDNSIFSTVKNLRHFALEIIYNSLINYIAIGRV